MHHAVITLLRYAHTLVLLFVVFACFVNNETVWLIHIILVPALLIHWMTNNNSCYLTDLEHQLVEKWNIKQKTDPHNPEVNEKFVRSLILKRFGRAPSDHAVEVGIRVVMISLWGISLVRYLGWH